MMGITLCCLEMYSCGRKKLIVVCAHKSISLLIMGAVYRNIGSYRKKLHCWSTQYMLPSLLLQFTHLQQLIKSSRFVWSSIWTWYSSNISYRKALTTHNFFYCLPIRKEWMYNYQTYRVQKIQTHIFSISPIHNCNIKSCRMTVFEVLCLLPITFYRYTCSHQLKE